MLVAIGVTTAGVRSILGVSVSLSEAEVHWREFLASLQDRGLHGVRYIVSDDHAGLKQAREARFAGVPWQRCQFHLAQNALHHAPSVAMRSEVARDLRGVLDASDRPEADRQLQRIVKKYAPAALKLAAWLEQNVPEALTVLSLRPTAGSYAPPTCSNESTKRSNDAPASLPSSPTKPAP